MGKVVAIGIDGAPWELVDRFIASGSLPTFKRLVEEGASGDLRSTIPAVTSPAWKCYSTGKNPGKLGVFWWTRVDFPNRKMTFVSAADFKSLDHWDYIADSGEFCTVINMPMTYPPPAEFNGVMVSGVPGFENDEYTFPKDLKADLVKRHGYRIAPEILLDVDPVRAIDGIARLIDMRFDVAEEFFDRSGFLQISIFFIDDVQHFTWRQMKEGKGQFRDSIERLWSGIDTRIGRLMDRLGPEDHLVIFSDHGFTDFKAALYINQWLGEDLIPRRRDADPGRVSMTSRMIRMADRLHLTPVLRKMLSEERRRGLQDKALREELERREFFDWERTRVYGEGEGPIYINRELVTDEAEYEALRDDLVARLEALEHPQSGERMMEKVWKREEAYTGPFVDRAPDLVAVPKLGYTVASQVFDDGRVWATGEEYHWEAIHRVEGILLLHGPEVEPGKRLEDARIYDVAPTILALKGLPVPDDMDGRVLAEAMRDTDRYRSVERVEGGVADRSHRFSKEEEDALQDRLRSLGYM